jgi:chromosome partitioning protein
MSRCISVLNFKGGTGKTSLVENLSYVLAVEHQRLVLVIDADRQSNSSSTLLGRSANVPPATLTNVLKGEASLGQAIAPATPIENLFVVRADTDLDTAAPYLLSKRTAYYTLRRQIELLAREVVFDYILIDHAGAYSPVMEAALLASQEMLIPCELEPFAVDGLFSMFAKLAETLGDHAIANRGIIPYAVDNRFAMSKLYITQMREMFGDSLILPSIRTDANVPKAQSVQKTVFEYAKEQHITSAAAEDFLRLAEFIDSPNGGERSETP